MSSCRLTTGQAVDDALSVAPSDESYGSILLSLLPIAENASTVAEPGLLELDAGGVVLLRSVLVMVMWMKKRRRRGEGRDGVRGGIRGECGRIKGGTRWKERRIMRSGYRRGIRYRKGKRRKRRMRRRRGGIGERGIMGGEELRERSKRNWIGYKKEGDGGGEIGGERGK